MLICLFPFLSSVTYQFIYVRRISQLTQHQRLMSSRFGRQDIVLEGWRCCHRTNHGKLITSCISNTMTPEISSSMTLYNFTDLNTGWDGSLAGFNFSCRQVLMAKALKKLS